MDKFDPQVGMDLQSYIGQRNTKEVRDIVAKKIAESLSDQSNIQNYKINRVDSLWNIMTFREKLKWFYYNKIRKKRTRILIDAIYIAHKAQVHAWKLEYPDLDIEECPYRLEFPNHLQSNPKTIIVSDIVLKLHKSVDYITVDIETRGLNE